ncbi:MAG: hypothetical protein ACK5NT_11745 [Pyrinomonadaceae bacterium]
MLNIDINNNNGVLSQRRLNCGYLQIFVAGEDGQYRIAYVNTGYQLGTDDCIAIPLELNEKIQKQQPLLYNAASDTSHLNRNEVARQSKSRIMTNFVFDTPGRYFIKIKLLIPDEENVSVIESSPIQITMIEPQGHNRAIWNRIRNRGDIAYFLQTGNFLEQGDPVKEKEFKKEIEVLTIEYPNTYVSNRLGQILNSGNNKPVQKIDNKPDHLQKSIDNFRVIKR